MKDPEWIERLIDRQMAALVARNAERDERRRAWRQRYGKAENMPVERADPKVIEYRATRGLDPSGKPMPKQSRPLCGAKTRSGAPCRRKAVPGKKRCPNHGGMSTGPKTAEGRERIAEAQRRRWAAQCLGR